MERNGIIESIKQKAMQVVPAGTRVVLFGSQARGDYHANSDWDLLILLNKTGRSTNADFDTTAYPFVELGWKIDAAINPIVYTNEEWEKRHFTPFYKNVEKDGIKLWS
ncbi:MAG: nucleotidyltransferase domain-containing protein [Salinivirgaceae bacterium]|nr:nucleotidyltransferase domain-containing protein [Salinivirgaceae bacterium]